MFVLSYVCVVFVMSMFLMPWFCSQCVARITEMFGQDFCLETVFNHCLAVLLNDSKTCSGLLWRTCHHVWFWVAKIEVLFDHFDLQTRQVATTRSSKSCQAIHRVHRKTSPHGLFLSSTGSTASKGKVDTKKQIDNALKLIWKMSHVNNAY